MAETSCSQENYNETNALYNATLNFLEGLHVMMDGTFKFSSSNFYQVYIIHESLDGQIFPLVNRFLAYKTTNTWNTFLCELIQIDFEFVVNNAIYMSLKTAEIRGCFSILAKQFGGVFKV